MQDIRKRFGRRVREVRTSVGMTQDRLALLAGLDRSYMGGIERGERNLGRVNIGQIATALGAAVADLFPSKEPKKVVSQDDARKSRETPGVVVFENVKHLLAHDGGRTFAVIAARLRRAG